LKIGWYLGDCRTFNLHRQFALIIFPYNSLQLLKETEDVEKCLENVHNHLQKNGLFIFDCADFAASAYSRNKQEPFIVNRFVDPESNEEVVVRIQTSLIDATRFWETRYVLSPSCQHIRSWTETVSVRMYPPADLQRILEQQRFSVQSVYGDFAGNPYKRGNSRSIFVCRKETF